MMAETTLQRFVDAQDSVYGAVVAELSAGRKRSHWIWFIFPQLRALGRSQTALYFGIKDRAEAAAYMRHPILGRRFIECSELLVSLPDQPIADIMGTPDDLKLRSSMTLFAEVAPTEPVFRDVLAKFYGGKSAERTVALLAGGDE